MKKMPKISWGNIPNIVLAILALWVIIPVFLAEMTIDSVVARFGMASACIANLFSKHRPIQVMLIIVAFLLMIVATVLYVHKANNVYEAL